MDIARAIISAQGLGMVDELHTLTDLTERVEVIKQEWAAVERSYHDVMTRIQNEVQIRLSRAERDRPNKHPIDPNEPPPEM